MELRKAYIDIEEQKMDKEVVFAKIDGKKEVYDPSVHWLEKPWVTAYQLTEITLEKWEWILTHTDWQKEIRYGIDPVVNTRWIETYMYSSVSNEKIEEIKKAPTEKVQAILSQLF